MTGIMVVNEFLHSDKFDEIHSWLLEAAGELGIRLQLKTNAQLMLELAAGSMKEPADFILFWDKDVRLALYLEKMGYPVFNSPKAIEICDDKSLTYLTLLNAGIKMPKTIIAPMTFGNIGYTNYRFVSEAAELLGFPIIVKECFGSFGWQVYKADNEEELMEIVRRIGSKPFLFQEFIQSSYGRDLRLQVVGDGVIAAMERISDQGDFRANLTIGGSMKKYKPTVDQCELALRSCEVIGLDFAGVDLLFGEDDEMYVCEVNSNAHFKNIYDCTGVNAAQAIMKHIVNRLEFRQGI